MCVVQEKMCQVFQFREGVTGDGGDGVVVQIKIFKTVRFGICECQSCDRGDGVIVSRKLCQRGR